MSLRIGKIWDSEFPWDVRVEKVCAALTEAGHTVDLACRNRDHQPHTESWQGITIHRMPTWPTLPRRAERISSFPAFINPRWYRHVLATFRRCEVEVILCRDLPLAPLALHVGQQLNRPVVVDVAEHYAGLLRDLYNRHDFRLYNLLIRNPLLAALVERLTLPAADHVLVVVEESGARLIDLGVDPDRITVVSNTPLPQRLAMMADMPRPERHDADPLRLVYLGKVEHSRGVGTVLETLKLRRDRGADPVHLDVFGDGASLAHHQATVDHDGLADVVTFHGHQPYDDVLRRLPAFDAGLIPHHATDHWNYTIQNKLFDYMAAGLPVVVSSMPPAERIVTTCGSGLVFEDRNPVALSHAMDQLADPEARRRMGRAGRGAVESTYNWGQDASRLVRAIERVAAQAGLPAAPTQHQGGSKPVAR